MNLAILVGVISSEIRVSQLKYNRVARFRLKTTEQFNLDGDLKERSQTHLIDVWNDYLIDNVIPLIRQGQMVDIHGTIESRKVSKDGEPDRWTTSIVVRHNGRINVYGGASSNTSVIGMAHENEKPVNVDHRPRTPTPLGDTPSDGLEEDIPI
ncbi:MAG: hypothetical protein CL472_07950 [Acidobacteria bacterium]|nr:hypothetical protein [Acidobacteriota bacterium]|tara:strand:- start:191 stop:649 length:459 start_codon:yes stop_codon:yes gene_type:complete